MIRHGFILSLLVVVCGIWAAESAAWSYTNPLSWQQKWPEHFANCNGRKQSPIDLVYHNSVLDENLKPVRMFLKEGKTVAELQHFAVSNNGHTVVTQFPEDTFFVSFGENNTEQYSVASLHFHWGREDTIGSEHTIDGVQAALETHIVSYNKLLYQTFGEAAGSPNGLAVLGFLSDVRPNADKKGTKLAVFPGLKNSLEQLRKYGSKVHIGAFDLTKVMSQVNPSSYFRYEGSLTTPPCTENVLWTVFRAQIPILPGQLKLFRALEYSKDEKDSKMRNNFRSLQIVNPKDAPAERILYRSSP